MIFSSMGHSLPESYKETAENIGLQLCQAGWSYRGGYEEPGMIHMDIGAIMSGKKPEIFVPWQGFNTGMHGRNGVQVCHAMPNHLDAMRLAKDAYPSFDEESTEIQMYWVRNVYLMLGAKLDTLLTMLVYYQPNECTAKTGSAWFVPLAKSCGTHCFNIAKDEEFDAFNQYITEGV